MPDFCQPAVSTDDLVHCQLDGFGWRIYHRAVTK
jgi:hypothetical protein